MLMNNLTLVFPDHYFSEFSMHLYCSIGFIQGCHTSGKSQGKVVFFKVREMSGNFEICQGKNEF